MANPSRKKLIEELRSLQKERNQLFRRFTREEELAVGSVSRVNRRCGNPRCSCSEGEGHPQVIFLFKDEDGHRRCKLVRRVDETMMLAAGERYRQFRDDLKRLRAIENRQREILVALMGRRGLKYK